MESCEMSLIKYVLFIFNLIFAVSGIGIIIAAALVLADVGDVKHFVDTDLIAPPIVLIVVAAIVFIVAFLGCFGAIRESYNLLIAFAVCLLIIFITEMAIGIAAAVYKNDFGSALKTALKKSLDQYSQNEMEKKAWDQAQTELQCCGVEGPSDWQVIPGSCCHSNDKNGGSQINRNCLDIARGKYLSQKGCYEQMKIKFDENAKILIGVGIGIAFIEVIGIVLSCWLAHTIKKENAAK